MAERRTISQWSFNARTHCQRGHALNEANIKVWRDGRRECGLCVKWRRQHGPIDLSTHCPHGHRYTRLTIYVGPDGQRRCRTCRAKYDRRDKCLIDRCYGRVLVGERFCRRHSRQLAMLDEEYGQHWRLAGPN